MATDSSDVISAFTLRVLEMVIYCGVMPVLMLVGIVTNSLSCIVFYRLGLRGRINLCLLLLSLSDLIFLILQTSIRLTLVTLTSLHGRLGTSVWQHTVTKYHIVRKATLFLFMSNFLTTVAAVERLVSILSPLKARNSCSLKVVVVGIASVFILLVGYFIMNGFEFEVSCFYDMELSTVLYEIGSSSFYLAHAVFFDTLDNIVVVFGFPVLSLLLVTVCTVVIKHRLRSANSWRQEVTGSQSQGGMTMSKAEAKLHRMLVAVCCLHIVCVLPAILKDTLKFWPEFSLTSRFGNLFNTIVAVKDVAASVNCAFRFVFYVTQGSQFRGALLSLLGRRKSTSSQVAG
ncbi:hypothetical protein C0Q70_19727 [Pomacea canaliculata]|uniref:G-protein coupled receptors family 1 profile domain-containing protein n=2 Tax=Pomacea canaliculata TaxID=400727 RepID=A0A2T7NDK0_POMCA|nr:hypothetical protein C0Q70_19727 [Pomacea canaliculata]